MEELRDYLNTLIETFRGQPDAWLETVATYKPEQLLARSEAGQWSAHQVVAHVLAADQNALLPRMSRIMTEDRPQLPNWDEAEWMAAEYDEAIPLVQILKDWQGERRDFAKAFAELDLDEWDRKGLHPYHGERTLLWWLEYSVNHVKDHEQQLLAILTEGATDST